MSFRWFFWTLFIVLAFGACRKPGCTDPAAANYAKDATKEDGSCTYRYGCIDSSAVNFDTAALFSDGTCIFQGQAVLYLAEKLECDTVTVAIDNDNFAKLSVVFDVTGIECGQAGAATFQLDPGNYTYFVSSDDSCNWEGNFSITSRGCTSIPLSQPDTATAP